jgi:hypothetical protein
MSTFVEDSSCKNNYIINETSSEREASHIREHILLNSSILCGGFTLR